MIGFSLLQSLNELMASSDNSVSQTVVNTFCNLLSYYEMMKVTEVNSSGNGTDANGTSADSLSYLQVLVRQNLQDTCHWVSNIAHFLQSAPHVDSIVASLSRYRCRLHREPSTLLTHGCLTTILAR